MPCSARRSSDEWRTGWNRRFRRGRRPWISAKCMTVRVRCRATPTGRGRGRWTSGTSTHLKLLLHLWSSGPLRARARTARVPTRVKARVSTRDPTKARARVSTRVKARAPGGTRATCTKERAITVARWGTSVPSAGSIGRTIRTRFAPWTSRRRRLSSRWSARRAGW